MKFATTRPYANPETAARKLIEIANSVEAVQDGRNQLSGPTRYLSFTLALHDSWKARGCAWDQLL